MVPVRSAPVLSLAFALLCCTEDIQRTSTCGKLESPWDTQCVDCKTVVLYHVYHLFWFPCWWPPVTLIMHDRSWNREGSEAPAFWSYLKTCTKLKCESLIIIDKNHVLRMHPESLRDAWGMPSHNTIATSVKNSLLDDLDIFKTSIISI